jgi:hypothetical protein
MRMMMIWKRQKSTLQLPSYDKWASDGLFTIVQSGKNDNNRKQE